MQIQAQNLNILFSDHLSQDFLSILDRATSVELENMSKLNTLLFPTFELGIDPKIITAIKPGSSYVAICLVGELRKKFVKQ